MSPSSKSNNKNIIREKIIIYLDLSSKLLNKRDLSKAIEGFVHAKLELNPHHNFNIFFFKEGGEPMIYDNLNSFKEVRNSIDEAYKLRSKNENYFENGLFFCLSGIASSFLEQAITFRILVISDLPSSKNSDYMDALMNLVETVRTFPTFIDIIRIGNERIYSDDVKLRIITTMTNGGLFYINDTKELKESLNGLVHNKILPDLRPEGGQTISPQHKKYYQELALKLEDIPSFKISSLKCNLCENQICQYCSNIEDKLKICPSCGIGLHECCSALYSWKYNIGLKYIFRCPGCGSLLKIEERLVYNINGEEYPEDAINELEKISENENFDSIETWIPKSNETFNLTSENINPEPQQSEIIEEKKLPKMGLFGPRPVSNIEVTDNSREKLTGSQDTKNTKKELELSKLRAKRQARRESTQQKVIVCPVCSSYSKPGTNKCSKCGCPIRK